MGFDGRLLRSTRNPSASRECDLARPDSSRPVPGWPGWDGNKWARSMEE